MIAFRHTDAQFSSSGNGRTSRPRGIGAAAGWRVDAGLQPGPDRDGHTLALFGPRPDVIGWAAAHGRPAPDLVQKVRPLTTAADN